jgi:hypothetical protein
VSVFRGIAERRRSRISHSPPPAAFLSSVSKTVSEIMGNMAKTTSMLCFHAAASNAAMISYVTPVMTQDPISSPMSAASLFSHAYLSTPSLSFGTWPR